MTEKLGGWMNVRMDEWMNDEWLDSLTDGCTAVWWMETDRWMNRWMEGWMESFSSLSIFGQGLDVQIRYQSQVTSIDKMDESMNGGMDGRIDGWIHGPVGWCVDG